MFSIFPESSVFYVFGNAFSSYTLSIEEWKLCTSWLAVHRFSTT